MKKILSLFLLILLTAHSSCFAVQNYTFTRTMDETYMPEPVYAAYPEAYQDVGYVENEYPPQYAGQGYTKRTTVTETMRDETEGADKAISRAWGITGILGVLGLIAIGIIGVSTAPHGGPHGPHR